MEDPNFGKIKSTVCSNFSNKTYDFAPFSHHMRVSDALYLASQKAYEGRVKCSRKFCSKVEPLTQKFKKCSNCLVPYCSEHCQILDWESHKGTCKSEKAYYSQLVAWRSTLSPDLLANQRRYFAAWKAWIRTDKMVFLLKFIGKKEEDFDP